MNIRNITKTIAICIMLTSLAGLARAENIDPYDDDSQYACAETVSKNRSPVGQASNFFWRRVMSDKEDCNCVGGSCVDG
jgi:hypothetical protein